MDPMSAKLAALRMARIQCTALGHPQTSGLSTIDYFLSSTLMEPEEANSHYCEKLIRLPNLGIHYTPPCPEAVPLQRVDYDLEAGDILYWCCQSLFKYQPAYDRVFSRIALAEPRARFVFIEALHRPMTEIFQGRLQAAFAEAGLVMETHCRFLPRLKLGAFAGMAQMADVYLDSIGWSGFNSTLESLHWGLPIVTLPGKLMRGRHTYAVLSQAGVTETIARDLDHYIELAVELGRNPVWRQDVSLRLLAGRGRLYGDLEAIRALESFLVSAVAEAEEMT
jgi:predicted O-linked N-acetylglucosamine transferase (SPINDLY family)